LSKLGKAGRLASQLFIERSKPALVNMMKVLKKMFESAKRYYKFPSKLG